MAERMGSALALFGIGAWCGLFVGGLLTLCGVPFGWWMIALPANLGFTVAVLRR